MISIKSSEIVWKDVQEDGRFIVRERHIDSNGNEWSFDYMAEKEDDTDVKLKERISWLESYLDEKEKSEE